MVEIVVWLVNIYGGILFIRSIADWVGPFRQNVIVDFLHQATDPVVGLFKPIFGPRSVWLGIVGLLLLFLLKWLVVYFSVAGEIRTPTNPMPGSQTHVQLMLFLLYFRDVSTLVLTILFWWLLGYVILSWIGFPPHPAVELLVRGASAMLAPIRRLLPSFGGIDFSPIVFILLMQLLIRGMDMLLQRQIF